MSIFSEKRWGDCVKLLFFVRYPSLDIAREKIPSRMGELERMLNCSGLSQIEGLFESDRGSFGYILFGKIVNEIKYNHFKQTLFYS